MKSDRRHELKENALLGWILKEWERVKPFSQAILGGIIIAAVGIIAFQVLTMEGAQEKNLGWDNVFSAIDKDDRESLASTAEDNAVRASGHWAALLAAQQYLQDASNAAFTESGPDPIDLQEASELFDTLIKALPDNAKLTTTERFLKTKALLGKAQTLELESTEEKLVLAKETYAQIEVVWPKSAVADEAERRIKSLNDPQITGPEGFYVWYRAQDFKPAPITPGLPGTLNSFLPGSPDISIDSLGDGDLVPGSTSPKTDSVPAGTIKLPSTESGSKTPDSKPLESSKFSDSKEEETTDKDDAP
ncbi:MAG: tetratricopeptide repeat protein, partial [Pirellulales bacterium]